MLRLRLAVGALALAFLAAAAASSVLALVNGPVGPAGYSPALAELRPRLDPGSTLVLAPARLLDDEHGRDYLVWELRGNRICVERDRGRLPEAAAGRYDTIIRIGEGEAVAPETVAEGARDAPLRACPLIPDGVRADPAGDG